MWFIAMEIMECIVLNCLGGDFVVVDNDHQSIMHKSPSCTRGDHVVVLVVLYMYRNRRSSRNPMALLYHLSSSIVLIGIGSSLCFSVNCTFVWPCSCLSGGCRKTEHSQHLCATCDHGSATCDQQIPHFYKLAIWDEPSPTPSTHSCFNEPIAVDISNLTM